MDGCGRCLYINDQGPTFRSQGKIDVLEHVWLGLSLIL